MDRKTSEAQKRATLKYDANNTKQYHLKLNLTTDADIIAHLERQYSMQGYIKSLIREDMKKEAATMKTIWIARETGETSDAMRFSFSRETALADARYMLNHLTAAELSRTVVTVESYPVDVPASDPRPALVLWNDLTNDPVTCDQLLECDPATSEVVRD